MIEIYVAPFLTSSPVVDCMESIESICAEPLSEAETTVSAILRLLPSSVRTAGSPSSSSLPARNAIVSKLASLSAEHPAKAA